MSLCHKLKFLIPISLKANIYFFQLWLFDLTKFLKYLLCCKDKGIRTPCVWQRLNSFTVLMFLEYIYNIHVIHRQTKHLNKFNFEVNPPKYDCCEDMSNLTYLNDASVLFNLKQRYVERLIYVSNKFNWFLLMNFDIKIETYLFSKLCSL